MIELNVFLYGNTPINGLTSAVIDSGTYTLSVPEYQIDTLAQAMGATLTYEGLYQVLSSILISFFFFF